MSAVNKKDSIYVQLLKLLVLSALAAGAFFLLTNHLGDRFIENYYNTSDYETKKDLQYVDNLQKYVRENNLYATDTASLNKWVKKQKILILRVYVNNKKTFDSDYPDRDFGEDDMEYEEQDWETYYSVEFTDGTARIGLIGLYEYQLYNGALIVEILFAFILFLTLVLLGIRKKIEYMRVLSNEITILEGGSLDYEITVKGKDELASLADGLDHMRISFKKMIEREAEMMKENQKIITEMSHDLRTPVTTILLYLEILKKEKYENKEHIKEYCEKIEKKAQRMKQLTENLFEYSLVSGERKIHLEEPEYCEVIFYDLLSETGSYLRQNGFDVEFHIEWEDKRLSVSTEYIVRVVDNITSNIIKYAAPHHEVTISSVNVDHMTGFAFENRVKIIQDRKDSTGVGLRSTKNMMKKMNGDCRIQQREDYFRIELYFPYKN